MRDGKSLVADVYVPRNATGKLPTVLVQTPYGKNGMFRRIFAPSEESRSEAVKESLFLNPNYAFVVLDWRGSGASKQAGPPPTEGKEGPDGVDTIKWIAAAGLVRRDRRHVGALGARAGAVPHLDGGSAVEPQGRGAAGAPRQRHL